MQERQVILSFLPLCIHILIACSGLFSLYCSHLSSAFMYMLVLSCLLIMQSLPFHHSTEERLGSGAFGEVCRGTWSTPYGPLEVAIKMLKEGSSEKDQAKFLQEGAIMGQFKHPHILRMLGAVTVDQPVSMHVYTAYNVSSVYRQLIVFMMITMVWYALVKVSNNFSYFGDS